MKFGKGSMINDWRYIWHMRSKLDRWWKTLDLDENKPEHEHIDELIGRGTQTHEKQYSQKIQEKSPRFQALSSFYIVGFANVDDLKFMSQSSVGFIHKVYNIIIHVNVFISSALWCYQILLAYKIIWLLNLAAHPNLIIWEPKSIESLSGRLLVRKL